MPWLGDVTCTSCGAVHEGVEVGPVDLSIVLYPEVAERMRKSFRAKQISQYECAHFHAVTFGVAKNLRKVEALPTGSAVPAQVEA